MHCPGIGSAAILDRTCWVGIRNPSQTLLPLRTFVAAAAVHAIDRIDTGKRPAPLASCGLTAWEIPFVNCANRTLIFSRGAQAVPARFPAPRRLSRCLSTDAPQHAQRKPAAPCYLAPSAGLIASRNPPEDKTASWCSGMGSACRKLQCPAYKSASGNCSVTSGANRSVDYAANIRSSPSFHVPD